MDYLGIAIASVTVLIGIFWEPRKEGPLKVGIIGFSLFCLLIISVIIDVLKAREKSAESIQQEKTLNDQKIQLGQQKTLLEEQDKKIDNAKFQIDRLLDQNDDIKNESAQLSAKISVFMDEESTRFAYLVKVISRDKQTKKEEKKYLVRLFVKQLKLVESCDEDNTGDIYFSLFSDSELIVRRGPSEAKQISTDTPYEFNKDENGITWSKLTTSDIDSFRLSGYVRERDNQHWFTKKWLYRSVGEFNKKIEARPSPKRKFKTIPLDGGNGCKAELNVAYSMTECDSKTKACQS